jgi:hypothetical protein
MVLKASPQMSCDLYCITILHILYQPKEISIHGKITIPYWNVGKSYNRRKNQLALENWKTSLQTKDLKFEKNAAFY